MSNDSASEVSELNNLSDFELTSSSSSASSFSSVSSVHEMPAATLKKYLAVRDATVSELESTDELNNTIKKMEDLSVEDKEHEKQMKDREMETFELEAELTKLREINARITEENEKLRKAVQQYKDAARKENAEAETDRAPILKAIVGQWKMIASTNVPQYLARCREHIADWSDLSDVIFQMAHVHFGYNRAGQLTHHQQMPNRKYSCRVIKVGTSEAFVENNVLIEVFYTKPGEEYARQTRFVKDGLLHIVLTRYGIKCERIFERVQAEKARNAENLKIRKERDELRAELRMLEREMAIMKWRGDY
ncbi:unnamed protein product [Caenorhabditis sp. 36 PRJEB53466]|nr:unnamed protein product [Caenorhabditis sp. 36 PRJEB53466]